MRNVFQRALKIAPGQYRRHFRSARQVQRRSKAKALTQQIEAANRRKY